MPDSYITRLDMAKILTKMWNVSQSSAETRFADAQYLFDEEKGCIEAVSTLGFMTGTSENIFDCDAYLTYNELMKILVHAAGYDFEAESNGGYPNGYAIAAGSHGITRGINLYNGTDEVTKGHIAIFIYNTMVIPVNYYSVAPNGKVTMEKGNSLFEDKHCLYIDEGFVDGAEGMSVTEKAALGKSKVCIDGLEYLKGNTDTDAILGRKVKFYYWYGDKTREDYTLAYIQPDDADMIKFNASDINGYGNYKYTYTNESGKEKEFKFSKAADIIYNYREVKSPDEKLFYPIDCGEVYGFDTDGDGFADKVYINSYETYVISRINGETKTIYDKYDTTKSLNLDSDDYNVKIYNESREDLLVEELATGDVLSAAVSDDGEYIYAIVSRKSVNGIVESIDTSENSIILSGVSYDLEEKFAKYTEYYEIGMSGDFYLNFAGQIAAANAEKINGLKYGYLVKSYYDNGIGEKAEYLVYTDEGKFETFSLNKKINYTEGDVSERINLTVSGNINSKLDLAPQLIRYALGADNKITDVSVAISYSEDTLPSEYMSGFRKMIYRSSTDSNPIFKRNGVQAGGKAVFESDAKLFVIPKNLDKREDFAIGELQLMMAELKYDVVPYTSRNDSEKSEVGVLVGSDIVVKSVSSGLSSSRVAVISSVTDALNDKGEAVKKMEGYRDGEFLSYYTREIDTLGNADAGDVIQLGLTTTNEINDIYLVYDCDKNKFGHDTNPYRYAATNVFDSDIRIGVGYAYSNDGELLRVYYGNKENLETATFMELDLINASVYKITVVENGKVRTGTPDDIHSYCSDGEASKVVVSSHKGIPGAIVVYNGGND